MLRQFFKGEEKQYRIRREKTVFAFLGLLLILLMNEILAVRVYKLLLTFLFDTNRQTRTN